ncbi:Serine/Threonine-Protein Phosphatase 2A Regulatory Subunit B'' Subunit Alpha, partial [Manis pentadactyla]
KAQAHREKNCGAEKSCLCGWACHSFSPKLSGIFLSYKGQSDLLHIYKWLQLR